MSAIELAIIGYVRASHGPKHNESSCSINFKYDLDSDFMRLYSHFQSARLHCQEKLSLNL